MGKLIISETERKNILSLYESTNIVPPPSESVFVANKNPFKYPEYEMARREYSGNLKDGDMFYIQKVFNNTNKIKEFNEKFVKSLYNKTARVGDVIYTFLNPSIIESTNLGRRGSGEYIGEIKVKKNNNSPSLYRITKEFNPTTNKLIIIFDFKAGGNIIDRLNFQSISDLYNEGFEKIIPNKIIIEDIPDEYFEIRKIKRQQTNF